jgi:hypothetical protein
MLLSAFVAAVVVFAAPLVVLSPQAHAQAGAVLKLAPSAGTFYVGSTFDVSIVVDTGPQAINAVAAELRFPPDILQIANPAAGSSIISLWSAPPTYSNEEGVVRLQGGIPSPGVKTSQGVVTTISFRAMRPGSASLVFTGNSQVLANDGRGTNILSLTIGATYRIELPPPQGPAVSSPTHPDQNAWYRSRTPTLQWIAEEGVTNFAWSIDQDPGGTPKTEEPKGMATSTSFENLDDGLWYFHIRAKKGENWGGLTTFLIRIDGTPPANFNVEFAPREVTNERRPFVNFATTDALSGVNRYELRVIPTSGAKAEAGDTGSSFFISAQPPYRLSELEPGGYDVVIRAYDNAGNVREAIGHLTITAGAVAVTPKGFQAGPWFLPWWILLIIAVLSAAAGLWFFRRSRMRHKHLRGRLEEDLAAVRERLRRDLAEVSERLAEEEHLKERLAEQLKRLEGEGGASPRNGGRVSILFCLVVAAVALGGLFGNLESHALSAAQESSSNTSQTLGIPLITTYRGRIGSDELLYLGGTAPENAIVVISIAQEHQEPAIVETRADRDGRWSYLHQRFLQPGVYRVFARTRLDSGETSDWGPQVTIEVVSRTFSVGGVVLPYQTVFGIANVLLIIIAMGLGGTALLLNRKSYTLRRKLAREIHEAEAALQEGFVLLRRDLEKELELIGAAEFPTRKFSQEEKARREKLIADLQAIEERVRKEVEDIERTL